MKLLFSAAAIFGAAISSAGAATVTFTNLLDTSVVVPEAHSASYAPVSDEFLIGGATAIQRFNGITGASVGTMPNGPITPSGLGYFAITTSGQGKVYAFENSGLDVWRWNSTTDPAPVKAFDTPLFARVASAGSGTGLPVNIGFAGSGSGAAGAGSVQFFQDDGTTVTGLTTDTLDIKSALTINPDATIAFGVIDSGVGLPINKFTKAGGVWTQDATFVTTVTGAGPMSYDYINNVLIVHPNGSPSGTTIHAIDGTTGESIGSATAVSPINSVGGYNGSYIAPLPGSGTVWLAGRGVPDAGPINRASLYKWSYVYAATSNVSDWSVY